MNFSTSSLDRRDLDSTDNCSDNMLSYGVRNSIAAYLSFSESESAAQKKGVNRKKKSKSVYVLP